MDSYIRRTRWLQEQQAVIMVNTYAEALQRSKGKKGQRSRTAQPNSTRTNDEWSAHMRDVGVSVTYGR